MIPPLAEIAADPEFSPRLITIAELEAMWGMRRSNAEHAHSRPSLGQVTQLCVQKFDRFKLWA
jgi:hypothetical protein